MTYQSESQKVNEKDRREAEKAAEQKRIRDEKIQKAMETGEIVELASWTTECDDEEEECSLDIITECAMPDGSIKVMRCHTW